MPQGCPFYQDQFLTPDQPRSSDTPFPGLRAHQGDGTQFASRHGNLISVKARLELKAVDNKTSRVLAIDRQTSVTVDLTEQLAGKAALQEAAAQLAERLLPKLAGAQ